MNRILFLPIHVIFSLLFLTPSVYALLYRKGFFSFPSSIHLQPLKAKTSLSRCSPNDIIQIIESELPTPHPDIQPDEVVSICLNALQDNNNPSPNAGLEVNFNFSSDRCRAALGGDLKSFIEYASNPTFGSMLECHDWCVLNTGPLIAGTNTRGPMQTVLVEVTPKSKINNFGKASNEEKRNFLWTIQRERRPPRANCWLIHEVIYTKNAFSLTL